MDTIKAIPQNALLGAAANGLRNIRSGLDVVPLPQVVGGGLGQLLVGKAPEEVEEWSYGNSPLRISPYAGRTASFVPEFKQGRAQGVADAVLLPVAEAAAVGGLAGRGLRNMATRAIAAPTSEGRREMMSKAGAMAAGTVAAAAVPDVLKAVVKAAEKEAPARAATKSVVRAARRYEAPAFKPFSASSSDAHRAKGWYDEDVARWNASYAKGDDAYEKALLDSLYEPDYAGSNPILRPEVRQKLQAKWLEDDADHFVHYPPGMAPIDLY